MININLSKKIEAGWSGRCYFLYDSVQGLGRMLCKVMIPQTWRSLLCNSCRKHVVKESGKWKDTRSIGMSGKWEKQLGGLCINIWIWRYGEERGRLSVLQQLSPKAILGIPVFITGPSISCGEGNALNQVLKASGSCPVASSSVWDLKCFTLLPDLCYYAPECFSLWNSIIYFIDTGNTKFSIPLILWIMPKSIS